MALDSFNAFTVTVTPHCVLWKYTIYNFHTYCKLNLPRENHSPVNSTFHVNLTLIYNKLHCKRQIPFLAQKLSANKYKFHYNESILSLFYLFPESLTNMDIYGYN